MAAGAVVALVVACGCTRAVAPLPVVPVPSPTPAPPIVLPRDAGPHDALTEWWYYTGHLAAADGHAYGFEFVVFQTRREGAPTGYAAHFAISDIGAQQFSHQARFDQGTATTAFPLDVDGWTLDRDGAADVISAAMEAASGVAQPYELNLRLTDTKPPALHNGGYIEYGLPGGSYYYSRTRLTVSGLLGTGAASSIPVSGSAWMDHQWGNFVVTALGGWDWYSLQLDDRTELMLYVLRDEEGKTSGMYGSYVLADGSVQELAAGAVSAASTGQWTSPHTGGTYPSGWRLTLPDGARLDVEPQVQDQELWFPDSTAGAIAYWEGAVKVSGDRTGVGYVELTGYARDR